MACPLVDRDPICWQTDSISSFLPLVILLEMSGVEWRISWSINYLYRSCTDWFSLTVLKLNQTILHSLESILKWLTEAMSHFCAACSFCFVQNELWCVEHPNLTTDVSKIKDRRIHFTWNRGKSYSGFAESLPFLLTVSVNLSPAALTVTVYWGLAAIVLISGASNGTSYLAVAGSYIWKNKKGETCEVSSRIF